MQFYDFLMIGVLAIAVLFGAWKGLAWQVASIAAIAVSYIVALKFRAPLAAMISVDPPWNGFIAMFTIFAVCSLGIWIAFGFVRASIDRLHLRSFDRQLGALVGAAKGAALCIVITLFAVTLLGQDRRQEICQSKSGRLIARTIDQLRGLVPQEIHPILEPYLDKFDDAMAESGTQLAIDPASSNAPLNAADPAGLIPQQWTDRISESASELFGRVVPTTQQTQGETFEGTIQGFQSSPQSNNNVTWPLYTQPAGQLPAGQLQR